MRLALFGGTFDPVHYGHLLLAEQCREQCRLDEVWFMPAASPPHKREQPLSAAEHRVDMLRLAIGGHEALSVSLIEIERGGTSYTVDTLEHLRGLRPDDELFLLLGSDSLADLPTWRDPARVCELATPVAVGRAGGPQIDYAPLASLVTPQRLSEIRRHLVAMPLVELASSDIRRRVAAGRSIRYQTPRSVEQYIHTHGLYRDHTAAAEGN
jgi:nicotinate-nucleotide adenylyltransferase